MTVRRQPGPGPRLPVAWLLVVALLVAGLAADLLLVTLAAVLLALPAGVATVARWRDARRGAARGRSR